VERPNRDELLSIRRGEWQYDALIKKAEEKMQEVESAFEVSELPENPEINQVNNLLVRLRGILYDKEP